MGSFVGLKSIIPALLLVLLLHKSSSLVGAVDITYYDSTCSGAGSSCTGIDEYRCCVSGGGTGAVEVYTDYGAGCLGASYYNYGSCKNGNYIGTSNGNFCYYDGYFTAAYWFNSCTNRRRSLLGDGKSKACTGQMKPNAVVFTEDSTKGHWMLITSNVDELYSQLKNVNDTEKLDWIKAKGGSYKVREASVQIQSQQHA